MITVIDKLATMPADSGRNTALNGAAWTLGRWIAAGALEQGVVEDELYAAAERNGLVARRATSYGIVVTGAPPTGATERRPTRHRPRGTGRQFAA
jgi:hypothetical protein